MSQSNKSVVCPNCRASLPVNPNQTTVKCEYCGSIVPTAAALGESDELRITKMQTDAYKTVELKKQENEVARLVYEREMEKARLAEIRADRFKHSKLNKWSIVMAVITLLVGIAMFRGGHVLCGLIAIVQTILFVSAFLMGRQVIPEILPNFYLVPFLLSCLLIIPFLMTYSAGSGGHNRTTEVKKIEAEDLFLGEMLPELPDKKGEIHYNYENMLSITYSKISPGEYKEYREKCKDLGFTIDSKDTSMGYNAYCEEGYKLSLYYMETNKELNVNLSKGQELSEMEWPEKGPATILPNPDAKKGRILSDSSTEFEVYVGLSKDEYADYVRECEDLGFKVDYSSGEEYYEADNPDGCHLRVKYEGNSVVYIQLDIPKKTEEHVEDKETTEPKEIEHVEDAGEKSETTEQEKETDTSAGADEEVSASDEPLTADLPGIRPEVKEALDSYETIMIQYCEFMASYDVNDVSMLGQYMTLLGKYEDAIDKFNAIDETTLNPAEAAYYTEISLRVTNMFANAAINLGQ